VKRLARRGGPVGKSAAATMLAVAMFLCGFVSLANADDGEGENSFESRSLWNRPTLTNEDACWRQSFAERGVTTQLNLTQVYQQNTHGGLSTHRHKGRYSGRYDIEVEADLETLFADRVKGKVYGLARGGWSEGIDDPSVGDLFGVNAVVVGDRPIDLWQLYYERSFFEDRVSIRVGKIDLTGCFECRGCAGSFDGNAFANDETAQFLNGSLVNNPTIPFPDPGLGAVLHYTGAEEWWYLSMAVADANSDVRVAFQGPSHAFAMFELGFLPQFHSRKGILQGAYRFGTWYDPQPKERWDGHGTRRGDVGFYLSFDQMIWKENCDEDDSQGVGLFGRYGFANSEVNEVHDFWSVGVQWQGLIGGRDDDVLGIGVGQGRLSQAAGFTLPHETVLELYYSAKITPWFSLDPSIQVIANPGGDQTIPDSFIVGLRSLIAF